jgi:hypothetical protein
MVIGVHGRFATACARQRFGHLGIKGCSVTCYAWVFVVAARLDALGLHVFTVEHDDMGLLVVHPDHSVKSAHQKSLGKKSAVLFGQSLASDASFGSGVCAQACRRNAHATVGALAIGACLNALQCRLNVAQLGRFVFVHGELDVALRDGLGPVLKIADIVLGGHVSARDQPTPFLGDALQQLSALMQEPIAVKGGR